ncbi:hypothetical protein F2P81_003919 [Scophthalmus maximus]|nr:hypothetical protein F2P81_003919 [Scophthalmus maximus]
MLERQPGLIFDLLMEHQQRHGAPTPAEVPEVPWCTCGHSRDMATDWERKCCGQDPAHCVSLLPHFTQYCLDEGYLRIHRQYREDLTAFGNVREPGDDNREYRHPAYRHFIFWQHGALGQGEEEGEGEDREAVDRRGEEDDVDEDEEKNESHNHVHDDKDDQ